MTPAGESDVKDEIDRTFPFVEMPPRGELLNNDPRLGSVGEELEQYRGKPIDGTAIRLLHQELYELSPAGWRWILPYYLRYCLTPEAEYSRMETEFLIYNLSPKLKFYSATEQRLSLLNAAQVTCLIHFLEWCRHHEHWGSYCPEDIGRSISFLETVLVAKGRAGGAENIGHPSV